MTSSSPSRGLIPFGLIAMLAMSAGVEFGLARKELNWMTTDDWDWRSAERAARTATGEQGLILFGDSQVKLGVLPPLVERTSGRKTLGLAVAGGHAAGSYYLAKTAFAAGAKPKAILIDFLPHYLAAGPDEFSRPWEEILGVRDCAEMSIRYRDADFAGSVLMRRLLPSMRYRTVLRSGFLAALEGRFVPKSWETAGIWRNLRINRGGMAWPLVPSYNGGFDPNNTVLFPKEWSGESANVEYARKFLRLAHDRGVRVYWLLPPIVPDAQKRRDSLGIEARWDAFVQKFQNEFDNLVVLDARHSGYGGGSFWDPLHLTRSGSATLSNDVGMSIDRVERQSTSSTERWVSLPRYRSVELEKTVEDISQSRLAVENRGEGKLR